MKVINHIRRTPKLILPQAQTFSTQQQQYENENKSKLYSPSFDKEGFQKQFDILRPPAHEAFDRKLKVYGLSDGQFLINHYWIQGSVIVFPKRFFMWNVVDISEIKPHTLEILNFVKPRPDYLIIGTGETNANLDLSFYEHFKRLGIVVDTCPSFEACSTFNMCNEDNYNVACALLRPIISEDGKNLITPKTEDPDGPPEKSKNMPS